MTNRLRVIFLLPIYLGIRIFSFHFQPTTPLNLNPHLLNTVLAMLIIFITVALLIKKNILGWYIIAAEMILDGSGSFLQISGVTLRSFLLLTSLSIYFLQNLKNVHKFEKNKIIIGEMLIIAVLGLSRGWYFSNPHSVAISDVVPYLFLLYYFPLRELLKDDAWRRFCYSALQATILGEASLILFTYIGLTSGHFQLQDAFYHWFRDIANGKITLVEFNFYRLVLNEQLLLVPLLLYFIYNAIHKKQKYLYVIMLLFLLSLNLTRIYLIALVIGILILFTRKNWKRWLSISVGSLAVFLVIYSTLFLISSKGKSFGMEVFGIRIQSIMTPSLEESSLSRTLLLPKILDQIIEHPFIGRGFGSTISVFSPIENKTIATTNYDWGYLEILVELGIIGFSVWVIFLYNIAIKLKKLPRSQLAVFISLLIINITSPAVFHVFGLTLLALLFALGSNASSGSPVALSHTPEQLESSTEADKKNSAANY